LRVYEYFIPACGNATGDVVPKLNRVAKTFHIDDKARIKLAAGAERITASRESSSVCF
jgi:hypothetical protein